jgi:hypothetical protein
MIHPSSPYRQCLGEIISLAEEGASFDRVCSQISDRWQREYPATDNSVANGGFIAAGLWYGDGDFLETMNLISRAADFTDSDCNAANAGVDAGRAWQLNVWVGNQRIEEQRIRHDGPGRGWQTIEIDLSQFAGQQVCLRLYQLVLSCNIPDPGSAYWRRLHLQ